MISYAVFIEHLLYTKYAATNQKGMVGPIDMDVFCPYQLTLYSCPAEIVMYYSSALETNEKVKQNQSGRIYQSQILR